MDLELKGPVGTALEIASSMGNGPILRLLLAAGANSWSKDIYVYALKAGISNRSEDCIKALLKMPDVLNHCKEIEYWPLIHASGCCNARIVELLISCGTKVNDRRYISKLLQLI